MITETATVTAIDGDIITVSASVKTGCSQCQVSDDCGTSAVAKAFTQKSQFLTLRSPVPVTVGEQVVIGIPEQRILLASWLLYIVPLITLISSMLVLNQWQWHELASFTVSVLFSTASLWWVSRYFKQQSKGRFEPVLIRKSA